MHHTQEILATEIPCPAELEKYQYCTRGKPATGESISVDTPLHVAQRDISISDIKKWAHKHQGIDWNLFGYATAVKHSDGTLELINGQHRIQLVKWLLPDVQVVPAHIIEIGTDGNDYIGKLFADMNGGSQRRLTPEDLLWAEVIGRESKALHVKKCLEAAGLACGKVNAVNDNPQVSRHTFEACLAYGEASTFTAVNLFVSAFKPRGKIDSQIVTALTLMFSLTDYADYADISTRAGLEFHSWFQALPLAGYSVKDLHFDEYKNKGASNKWENGAVYGFVQRFAMAMRAQGKGQVVKPTGTAKSLYQGKFVHQEDE